MGRGNSSEHIEQDILPYLLSIFSYVYITIETYLIYNVLGNKCMSVSSSIVMLYPFENFLDLLKVSTSVHYLTVMIFVYFGGLDPSCRLCSSLCSTSTMFLLLYAKQNLMQ